MSVERHEPKSTNSIRLFVVLASALVLAIATCLLIQTDDVAAVMTTCWTWAWPQVQTHGAPPESAITPAQPIFTSAPEHLIVQTEEDWSRFPLCSTGLEQSPINIEPNAVILQDDTYLLEWDRSPFTVEIQQLPPPNTNFLELITHDRPTILIGNATYTLAMLELHAPGETPVDGTLPPLELQLHLWESKPFPWAYLTEPAPRRIAISIPVARGGEPEPFIAALSRVVEGPAGAAGAAQARAAAGYGGAPQPQPLSLAGLYAAWQPNTASYYRYMGSLTSPPCTEGVMWFVRRQPLAASTYDVDELAVNLAGRARPAQPANGRRRRRRWSGSGA